MQIISGQYYSAQLRFFRQLCTAAKVDTVSNLAKKMLDEGKCVVVGLQSTGEFLGPSTSNWAVSNSAVPDCTHVHGVAIPV